MVNRVRDPSRPMQGTGAIRDPARGNINGSPKADEKSCGMTNNKSNTSDKTKDPARGKK